MMKSQVALINQVTHKKVNWYTIFGVTWQLVLPPAFSLAGHDVPFLSCVEALFGHAPPSASKLVAIVMGYMKIVGKGHDSMS